MRVRSRDLETGSVNARIIAPGAVGRDALARWAVGAGNIAPGSVDNQMLAPAAVQAPQLADASVEAPSIAPDAVTTPAIADGAVTGPKVPAGALGARELADGSITLPKFVQGSRPVQLVDTLPVLPDDDHPPGAVVVNLTDGKVYRHHAPEDVWGDTWDADWPTTEGWTAQVDTYDLRGLIEEGQIGQGAVVAGTVAANAIGATELAAIFLEVDKWIRSFNWDPGVDGWAIDGDGTAEFNQVTVRNGVLVGGTLTASALVSDDYVAGTSGWALDPAGNTELNDVTIRGSAVVGSSLFSDNYNAGTAGWALDAAGNAELNDATFRGNIRASSVTSGQLVSANYDPDVDGWALDASGNAEFNDVTIRGGVMVGGTVSGAVIQTSDTGRRVVLANDRIDFLNANPAGGGANLSTETSSGSLPQLVVTGPSVSGGAAARMEMGTFLDGTSWLYLIADDVALGVSGDSGGVADWLGGAASGPNHTSVALDPNDGTTMSTAEIAGHRHSVPNHTHSISF